MYYVLIKNGKILEYCNDSWIAAAHLDKYPEEEQKEIKIEARW